MRRDRSDRSDTIATIAARIQERFSGDRSDRVDRIATIDTIATRAQSECRMTIRAGNVAAAGCQVTLCDRIMACEFS